MDFLAGILDSIPDSVSGLFGDIIGKGLSSDSSKSKYSKAMAGSSEQVPLTMGQIRTATSGKSTDTNPNKFANYNAIEDKWMNRIFQFYNMNKAVDDTRVQGPKNA